MEILICQAKVYRVMQHLIVQGPTVPVSTPAQNNLPRNHLQGSSVSLSSTLGIIWVLHYTASLHQILAQASSR